MAALRERGFTLVHEPPASGPRGYLAAPDADRTAELNAMLRRDDVDAILCTRGGFGVLRLLDTVDYDAARRRPKLLVGYSDITALQLALYRHAGWRSLSGAMLAPDWPDLDGDSEAQFWNMARGATPSPFVGPGGEPLEGVRDGSAEGVLLGGNLSMVMRLLSTPFLPDLDGAILFFEDVGEAPYRLDSYFAQLRLAGVLDRLGGVVVGALTDSQVEPGRPSLGIDEVLGDHLGRLPIPVARGLVYGHFPRKSTLPIGVGARLSVDGPDARLDILEPVTRRPDGSLFTAS